MRCVGSHLLAGEGLEGTHAVLGSLGGDAEHGDHRDAAVLELGGLEVEEGLGVGGAGDVEGVEVAAGVAALLGVELCEKKERLIIM